MVTSESSARLDALTAALSQSAAEFARLNDDQSWVALTNTHEWMLMQGILRNLSGSNFDLLPPNAQEDLEKKLARVQDSIRALQSSSLNDRDRFNVELRSSIFDLAQRMAGAISLLSVLNSREALDSLSKNFQTKANEYIGHAFSGRLSEFQERLNDQLSQAEDLVGIAKATVVTSGISLHSDRFKREAHNAEIASRWWLTGCISLFILMLVLINTSANRALRWIDDGVDITAIGGISSSILRYKFEIPALIIVGERVALVVVLLLALSACIKMYRSTRHQYIVNQQRTIALETVSRFAKVTDDEGIKLALMLEVIRSIFSHQPTGLVPGEGDGKVGGDAAFIELIRSIRGAQSAHPPTSAG